MDASQLQSLVHGALETRSYDAATFYANKLVSIEPNNPHHANLLAQCYYDTAQYKRVIHLLRYFLPRAVLHGGVEWPHPVDSNLSSVIDYMKCLHIAGKSHMKLNQFQECVDLLQNFDTAAALHWKEGQEVVVNAAYEKAKLRETKITALLSLLRAEALESLDIRASALVWYKKALEQDVTCVEAWKKLNEGFMQPPAEEASFLASLKFSPDLDWLKAIYLSNTTQFVSELDLPSQSGGSLDKLNSGTQEPARPKPMLGNASTGASKSMGGKSQTSISPVSSASTPAEEEKKSSSPTQSTDADLVKRLDVVYGLGKNEDVVASRAQALFYANRVREAFKLTSLVLEQDPYSTRVLETHLSCLVELGLKNELYLLAHKMAENAPKSALSWYAVGCYYFLIRSWQNARLYFGRATTMKREFGAAWLAYGYTFAQNGDHDQALFSYRTAARLLVGSHLPTLFIAIELTKAKDLAMAAQLAQKAVQLQPNDPYPWHEIAVITYRAKDYHASIKGFNAVLSMLDSRRIDTSWEPTIFNLAQAHLKLKQYQKAIEYLEWSLSLIPNNASTYLTLAFANHADGQFEAAVDAYHHVLSLTPDNDFAVEALDDCLIEWAESRVSADIPSS
jgi:anaphase-promoting complex subunit 6